ncbi:type VI secretion system baseplate subunit TssF [Paenochrobactrum glaciei]|uniref:Type VI secretion system baseplate subunit TssF n=1 Tax=Paenochrobactrum glaciei TaxID=486407 RepID=A0ABN1GHH2_9HYPH
MQKEFLALYHDELQSFRQQANAFAHKHPEAANKLRLAEGVADDPHVERLIESFAFTAARIRYKLNDSFPELSAGLLEALYPHLLCPLPAMGLVNLMPTPDLTNVQRVPRGLELQSETIQGDRCRFRTTQVVDLVPAKVSTIAYHPSLQSASKKSFAGAQSALKITLQPLKTNVFLANVGLKDLKFHLSGAFEQASTLYMEICKHTIGVKISDPDNQSTSHLLSANYVQPTGFTDDESLLPVSPNFNAGFRLLSEFFILKRKFLFFTLNGLEQWSECSTAKALELTIYFDRTNAALNKNFLPEHITLNTTPVVNLFKQQCEPLQISSNRQHTALVPDYRFRQSRKIHSILEISAVSSQEPPIVCQSIYQSNTNSQKNQLFWQIIREPYADEHDDIAINFSGHALKNGKEFVTKIEAFCTNGLLPLQLPYNAGTLELSPAKPHSNVETAQCLIPFTAPALKPLSGEQLWPFIAHLRHGYIHTGCKNEQVLKDILYLYQRPNDAEADKYIHNIQSIVPRSTLCRIKQGGFAAATDFNIYFTDNSLSAPEIYLFATVLHRFLNFYTSINSSARVTAWNGRQSIAVVRFPFHTSLQYAV